MAPRPSPTAALRRKASQGFERLVTACPPAVAATLDLVRPAVWEPWGGPCNGQAGRQEMVRAILAAHPFRAVVETGTHRGNTATFLRRESGLTVHTVDIDRRYFYYATQRLRDDLGIVVRLGDSRRFLRHLAVDPSFPKEGVFFYLDAHWGEDLPLAEEVGLVKDCWKDWVAVIDDFEVPGDPGYEFQDAGPGERLSITDFPFDRLPGVEVFWPSLPSAEETGFLRGCVVLASSGLAAGALASLAVLRRHHGG